MKMNMASGFDYDLCFTSDWLNYYDEAVRNGGLYDLTKYLEDIKTIVPEDIIKNVSYDGKIYGVPNIQIFAMPLAVKARKDLLEKYNFDLQSIKTVEDVEPFLKTIKEICIGRNITSIDILPITIARKVTCHNIKSILYLFF